MERGASRASGANMSVASEAHAASEAGMDRQRLRRECARGRSKHQCKECGGAGICAHGAAEERKCSDRGGVELCAHGRQRYSCKECGDPS